MVLRMPRGSSGGVPRVSSGADHRAASRAAVPSGPRVDTALITAEARSTEGTWSLVSMDASDPNSLIHVVGSGMRYDDFANMTVELRVDPEDRKPDEHNGSRRRTVLFDERPHDHQSGQQDAQLRVEDNP
jgi:hypothetical protein